MGRVIHFEITADDVDRAAAFYSEAFGWEVEGSPFVAGYRLADTGTGPGINGAVMARQFQAQPAIVWLEVDDIDDALDRVRGAGGCAANEKQTIPDRGHVVYVRDTEGNLLGLEQPLEAAPE